MDSALTSDQLGSWPPISELTRNVSFPTGATSLTDEQPVKAIKAGRNNVVFRRIKCLCNVVLYENSDIGNHLVANPGLSLYWCAIVAYTVTRLFYPPGDGCKMHNEIIKEIQDGARGLSKKDLLKTLAYVISCQSLPLPLPPKTEQTQEPHACSHLTGAPTQQQSKK